MNQLKDMKKEMEEGKHCLECGSPIEYYRKGKIFCDDLCRSRYHNRDKNWVRNYHTIVIGKLERNCSILKELLSKEITSVDLGDLEQWGFRIEYATSVRKMKTHMEYRCFEYKFFRSDSRIFGLERIKPLK